LAKVIDDVERVLDPGPHLRQRHLDCIGPSRAGIVRPLLSWLTMLVHYNFCQQRGILGVLPECPGML
jgi:hypothetical protein